MAGLDGNVARQSQDEVFWRREQDGHGPFCLSLSHTPYLYVLTKLKMQKHELKMAVNARIKCMYIQFASHFTQCCMEVDRFDKFHFLLI